MPCNWEDSYTQKLGAELSTLLLSVFVHPAFTNSAIACGRLCALRLSIGKDKATVSVVRRLLSLNRELETDAAMLSS